MDKEEVKLKLIERADKLAELIKSQSNLTWINYANHKVRVLTFLDDKGNLDESKVGDFINYIKSGIDKAVDVLYNEGEVVTEDKIETLLMVIIDTSYEGIK